MPHDLVVPPGRELRLDVNPPDALATALTQHSTYGSLDREVIICLCRPFS
jgi:hypothetical protein